MLSLANKNLLHLSSCTSNPLELSTSNVAGYILWFVLFKLKISNRF